MCYHYSLKAEKRELERRYMASLHDSDWKEREHLSGFDSGLLNPVITNDKPDTFLLFKWGLLPFWAKEEKLKYNTANAKCEGIDKKPVWRKPIKSQRCLVPATGFFEWRDINKIKYPYHIKCRDQEIFSFAGIWDEWVNKDSGEIINSYSIITTEANELMGKIHNVKKRMPVILQPDDEKLWLSDTEFLEIEALLKQYPTELMEAYTIRKDFMRLGGFGEEILEQEEYPELALYDV
jgi:putative SOS response-associated peptidase YedK